nr:reverse transcriptase domain-containing protein [Tanacetum cinerariifolium]
EPSPPLPNHEQYLPSYKKELKVCEAKTVKSFVDEPPEVELKDLPPHLEYAFLEGDDKFPVIIAKELGDEEKSALIKVLKSHKRAIAWKLSDIQGINPEFCTHKILMEEDYKPVVQHQRRVNPKIHDGGFTMVENEENELIPTRLVTEWRVCIDYRKLNEATRKDHFPLQFMDQMLERLAGNEYYCFLDGFSGNLFPPLDNPELTIRRRSRTDPTLLNNSEMVVEGPGDLPVPDLRTMEELCQPSLNDRDTFYNGLTLRHRDTINAAAGGTFMKRRPKECYDLIKNMTAHHNDWDTSGQRSESSSSITSSSDTEIAAMKAKMAEINKNLMRVLQVNQQVKAVIPNCETCGGPHSFNDCLATNGITQNVYAAGAYQDNSYQPQGNRNLLNYRSDNYLGPPGFNQNQNQNFHNQNRNKGYYNPQGNNQGRNQFFEGANQGQNQPLAYQASVYQAPVHQSQIPQPQVVTTNEFTNFMKANDDILKNMQTNMTSLTNSNLELKNMFVHPTNNGSTEDVQPSIVQTESLILNSEPVVALIIEPVASPVSAPKPNQRPSIPYPSRLHDQKLRDKANDQREKFFQIFKDLNFNISFVDALILMPKFGPTIKSLLTNKDKLCELARTPMNDRCSAVLLKKLPEKLADPGKFLIPCDFPRMAKCLALADLGTSINLMPLSVWNKLLLPDLSPTCMTLELADRLISRPVRVAEDVFVVKVGTFYFPADFVVVDLDVDPRVPLILRRSFLKTGRALIDVFEGELTLHVGKEAITFNLDQTSRYLANYNDMTANRIDVIDMTYEEYSQEVLSFSNVIASGNPTPYYDPIVSITSPTLTPFRNSDFLLEEVDAFLALEDDLTSPEVDQSYVDTEGDILILEAFLNDDPSLRPPNQGNYLPQVRKELKICEAKSDKSSIDEPPEVGLKDLPPHLEYAFLEGDDKLPVIIAEDLSVEEKTAFIMVLKLHKRAIAWKLSDIKGINPEFCTHKILMEEDFKPAGGFTVVENEENELIPTLLVTGWRVCIDYQKMLKRCEDANLCLNWEKIHFMVKEGIVLGYKISKNGIKVDKAKVNVIAKLPHPTTIKGIHCFLGHAGFYRRKLTEAPILIAPDWDMSFELMCDASNFAICLVLGQRQEKHFRPIYYASKTMTEAESNYTTTEKEMLAVVTLWFADFANYHEMNFVVKGMSSQQKKILQGCEALFLGRPLSFQNLYGSSDPKSREIEILGFLCAYFIALREDTQHLSRDFAPRGVFVSGINSPKRGVCLQDNSHHQGVFVWKQQQGGLPYSSHKGVFVLLVKTQEGCLFRGQQSKEEGVFVWFCFAAVQQQGVFVLGQQ